MRGLAEIHSCLVVAIELALKMTQTDEHISLAQAVVDRLVNRTRLGKRGARFIIATERPLVISQGYECIRLSRGVLGLRGRAVRFGNGWRQLDTVSRDKKKSESRKT